MDSMILETNTDILWTNFAQSSCLQTTQINFKFVVIIQFLCERRNWRKYLRTILPQQSSQKNSYLSVD